MAVAAATGKVTIIHRILRASGESFCGGIAWNAIELDYKFLRLTAAWDLQVLMESSYFSFCKR